MKRVIIVLLMVALTAIIVVFPDLYYGNISRTLKDYHNEESLEITLAENIDVDKMLDVAEDEDSLYTEVIESESERSDVLMDVLTQLEELLYIYVDDKKSALENCLYQRVKILGNSAYNTYLFSLCEITLIGEDFEFYIWYLPETEKILLGTVVYYIEPEYYFYKIEKDVCSNLDDYYVNSDNWIYEISNYCISFNQGSDATAIKAVSEKLSQLNYGKELTEIDGVESEEAY